MKVWKIVKPVKTSRRGFHLPSRRSISNSKPILVIDDRPSVARLQKLIDLKMPVALLILSLQMRPKLLSIIGINHILFESI